MPVLQRSFIALGTDGTDAVLIGDDRTIWKQNGASWDQLAGIPNVGSSAREAIGAASYGASDEVVILVRTIGGPDTELMILSGGVWVSLARPPHSTDEKYVRQIVGLSRYDASDLAAVCNDGSLFTYSSGTWTQVAGPPRRGT